MQRAGLVLIGAIALCAVTFANPLEGSVLGFCPLSEGPKAVAVDGFVALIDGTAVWLIARGLIA
jgi:hypothetical protein